MLRLLAEARSWHNAEQSEPMWPSVAEMPIKIDKTAGEPYVERDAYSYWPN